MATSPVPIPAGPAVERRAVAPHVPAPRPAPQSVLTVDDLATLRRLTALSAHVLHLLVDAAGLKETRKAAYSLAEELAAWHRRHEPKLYGRDAGAHP